MPRGTTIAVDPRKFASLRTQAALSKTDFEKLDPDFGLSRKTISAIAQGQPVHESTINALFNHLKLPVAYFTSTLPLEFADAGQLYDALIVPKLDEAESSGKFSNDLKTFHQFLSGNWGAAPLPLSEALQPVAPYVFEQRCAAVSGDLLAAIEILFQAILGVDSIYSPAASAYIVGPSYRDQVSEFVQELNKRLGSHEEPFFSSLLFFIVKSLSLEQEYWIKPPAIWEWRAEGLGIVALGSNSAEISAQVFHEYVRAGGCARILALGGAQFDQPFSQAEATAAFLRLCGVPPEQIVTVPKGLNLREQIRLVFSGIPGYTIQQALFVSEPLKLARVLQYCQLDAQMRFHYPRIYTSASRGKFTLATLKRSGTVRTPMLEEIVREIVKILFNHRFDIPKDTAATVR